MGIFKTSLTEELINYCNFTIEHEFRCKKHKQACRRFLEDLERVKNDEECPFYWNEEEAQKALNFFTYLKHSKGVLAGKPIILEGLSKFICCNIYGFYLKKNGYRRFRKAFISMARKGQKSQLQGGIALYEMSVIATKYNNLNECYCAGVRRKQSKIIFDECKLMLRGSIFASKFKITRDKIEHIKTGSFLEALSKEDKKSGEGTNPALGILDEYKDHEDNGFYETLETGMNAQKSPLLVIISTAGNNLSCPMYVQEYPYCSKILSKEVINDDYFTVICEVEKGDDITDFRVWEKANELLFTYEEGITGLKKSYNIAKEIPEKMTSFLVKNLNMWQNKTENTYIDIDKLKACVVKEIPYNLYGKDVYIGIDVASKTDLCSVTFEFPILDGEVLKFVIKTTSFIPNEEKLREHILTDKQPFEAWLRAGFVKLTKTPIVDQKQVIDYCINACKSNNWNIKAFGVDPHNAGLLTTTLSDLGYDVFEIYQSKKHLNEPTVDLREQIYCKNVIIEENQMLIWEFGNAKVIEHEGLIKIDKSRQRDRIDNVDSTICSHKLAMYWKNEVTIDLNEKILSDDFFM